MSTVIVVGGGVGGLAVAALLGRRGDTVTVLEKNELLGGRANYFEADGFSFDMGPSWYLMPDVFEHFFALLGERVSDHLELQRLDPSYRITFRGSDLTVDMTSDLDRDAATFENLEPGSGEALRDYLAKAETQYGIAIENFMYRNRDGLSGFLNRKTASQGRQLHVFENMHRYVSRWFSTDIVRKIMEYQLVFLGSSPYTTPALYNIMSHIDFNLGVFYPRGGIYSIVRALTAIGAKHGVRHHTQAPVAEIVVEDGRASGVRLESGEVLRADTVISNADMHHTETVLLPRAARSHSDRYWARRTLAPSAFIIYLGVRGRLPSLTHHNLAFGQDWRRGFAQIFDTPAWPDDPSYYVCAPSRTDPGTAPAEHENLFVLVPVAPESADASGRHRPLPSPDPRSGGRGLRSPRPRAAHRLRAHLHLTRLRRRLPRARWLGPRAGAHDATDRPAAQQRQPEAAEPPLRRCRDQPGDRRADLPHLR